MSGAKTSANAWSLRYTRLVMANGGKNTRDLTGMKLTLSTPIDMAAAAPISGRS